MEGTTPVNGNNWTPSVYQAESTVNRKLSEVWPLLLNYEAWNPSFSDAQVSQIVGDPRSEGGIVLIRKNFKDGTGEPIPEFYAETAKLVQNQQIVWYVYPKEGQVFRNFVDFRLREVSQGVNFSIHYYAQDRLPRERLIKQRAEYQQFLNDLAIAFKRYCETHA